MVVITNMTIMAVTTIMQVLHVIALMVTMGAISTRLKSKVVSLDILILLIWTNVPRINVALKNVVVTVVFCCICSQDPLFKV